MTDVKYQTANEKRMIEAIQRVVGALPNGIIGNQTLSDILVRLGAFVQLASPLTLSIYGHPVIMAKDVRALAPGGKAGVKAYANSISGSFTWPSGATPCSIAVQDGKLVHGAACHAHLGKPESVLYKTTGGQVGVTRMLGLNDQLARNYAWAVGGMGLLGLYDPPAEGFTGAYADVLRRTAHTVLGEKNGVFYLVHVSDMTGAEANAFARDKLMLSKAIMLDGGHIAAINGGEGFAQKNLGTMQGYVIQGY